MIFTKEQLHDVIKGTDASHCVEALRQLLDYPLKERDPGGSRFWYLRPGTNEKEAEETCPIAVGFYEELSGATDQEIKRFLTSKEQQQEIYGHYISRIPVQQPVMYLLLPSREGSSRVPLVLPSEGGLRQRDIKTFEWNEPELQRRLSLLQRDTLPIAHKAICSVPSVKWVFYEPIKTANELATSLADAAREIEQAIHIVYKHEANNGYLHTLLESFKKQLLPMIQMNPTNENDYSFPDIYAQTITYGLFTARVFSHIRDKNTPFNQKSAWEQLPKTNPFLRRLFQNLLERSREQFKELGDALIDAIAEIFSILCTAEMDAILWDFQQKMHQEDIVIRFYEDFLKAYKPQMRERRGVYYTPEPVVSYIVRSVDHILKTDFGLPDGLADDTKVKVKTPDGKEGEAETHKVLITDVATGTGNFLYGVINHIYDSFKFKQHLWSDYVSQDLLPRLLGFELLMAPYAVAHMKLGLQLAELGYKFDTEQRLRVYLTNTLQEAFQIPIGDGFDNWIKDEADAANEIKQEAPVMVILGNPPYSGQSANNGIWISNLIKGVDTITNQKTTSYFEVDAKPLGERKTWLNDDYVKFIRFAQWRIEQTGYGVLAFITNHGYVDNPTFRGMRQSLMTTFDDIYVLDLHGNSNKKEQSPDGSKDENVFDIKQGVAISIFVKRQNDKNKITNIYHSNLYGLRESKYQWLKQNDLTTTAWTRLKPKSPFYLFIPQDTSYQDEYNYNWKVTDIFPVNSTGIVTARDAFVIDLNKKDLLKRMEEFRNPNLPDNYVRSNFFQGKGSSKYLSGDTRGWKLTMARKKVQADLDWEKRVASCLYRPFDVRNIYYTEWMIDWHRKHVMRHMLEEGNLGLITTRQTRDQWDSLVTEFPCVHKACAVYDINSLFPLYLYPNTNSSQESVIKGERCPNLSSEFLKDISLKLGYTPTPEAILYYIYAIFYSPTYRIRYAEFLKTDFPRVPLTSNDKFFKQLSTYGEELVGLHLMKSPKLESLIINFVEISERTIDPGHPKYSKGEVIINKKGDRFTGVPEEVWNFHVGGYQVCQKWLKDRKGRTLSDEDIQHYQRIIVALKETIELMAKIDAAIPSWPIQ